MAKPSIRIHIPQEVSLPRLFGPRDVHLRNLERALGIRIAARGHEVLLEGEAPALELAHGVLEDLIALVQEGFLLREEDVVFALRALQKGSQVRLRDLFQESIPLPTRKRWITPKTPTQVEYLRAIRHYDIVIGIGPAGTGKTYLAMAMAIHFLLEKTVSRILLTRPAVEAGERLGYLPGDLYEKVHPYLRPLYDALYDMMEADRATRMVERGEIEIAPLAFMRGRTLNDAFVILDEAQNATSEQMKMFLTRMGFGSKVVITGDVTQVDLPPERISGLVEIQEILSRVEGIRFVYFTEQDVVRHPLVQDIIRAYDEYEARERIRSRLRKSESPKA